MTTQVAQLDKAVDVEHGLRSIARSAIASLHAELTLAPKPGLVCPDDRGSHDDMDATTMMRSLVALRHGFREMVFAAADDAPFATLQAIGVRAEQSMLRATGGVNTHRGAIFTIGALAASAAHCVARGIAIDDEQLRATLRRQWGRDLMLRPVVEASHGRLVATRHGAGGARREAADGFPTVFEIVLPALREARRAGHDERRARLHALMTAIARVEDTNLLYRGGSEGLDHARDAARDFLRSGGVSRSDCDNALRAIGRGFVARRLSPGGSADLLAAALFVDRVIDRVIVR
jgi:triphosphoribosyl-dephospho-CoA synthase